VTGKAGISLFLEFKKEVVELHLLIGFTEIYTHGRKFLAPWLKLTNNWNINSL